MKRYMRGSTGPSRPRLPENPRFEDLRDCFREDARIWVEAQARALLASEVWSISTQELSERIARTLTGIGIGSFTDACAHVGGLLQEVAKALVGLTGGELPKCYVTQAPDVGDGSPRPWRWHGAYAINTFRRPFDGRTAAQNWSNHLAEIMPKPAKPEPKAKRWEPNAEDGETGDE